MAKCGITLKKYLSKTLKEFQKTEEKTLPSNSGEKSSGLAEALKDISNKDIFGGWTLKEIEKIARVFNRSKDMARLTSLSRLLDNDFVKRVDTPFGFFQVEKKRLLPVDFFGYFGYKEFPDQCLDKKIGLRHGFFIVFKKEMIKRFCCGPLVEEWKAIKAADPKDIKLVKFDSKGHVLEIAIICPKCKRPLS